MTTREVDHGPARVTWTLHQSPTVESHGEPGRLHVSDAVRARLGQRFALEARGVIQVKGKGEMSTWFLERHAESGRTPT